MDHKNGHTLPQSNGGAPEPLGMLSPHTESRDLLLAFVVWLTKFSPAENYFGLDLT